MSDATEVGLVLGAEIERLRRVLDHWHARAAQSPNLAVTLTAEEIARERNGRPIAPWRETHR